MNCLFPDQDNKQVLSIFFKKKKKKKNLKMPFLPSYKSFFFKTKVLLTPQKYERKKILIPPKSQENSEVA